MSLPVIYLPEAQDDIDAAYQSLYLRLRLRAWRWRL
jgi:hypothetical protein